MGPFAQRSAISIQATCRFGIGTQWVPCSNQNDVTHRDDRLTSRAAASNAPQSSRNPHQDRPNSGRKLGAFPSGCFIDFRALSGHFQGKNNIEIRVWLAVDGKPLQFASSCGR